MSDPLAWIPEQLDALRQQGLFRQRRVRAGRQAAGVSIGDQQLINFGSNDYLGLAGDRRLDDAVQAALAEEGWGSGASPLVTGYTVRHQALEQELARFEGTEAALVFPSGFAANMGAIAALVGPGDVVFTDRKNHASLLDGCRLSRADVRVYPHDDPQRLGALMARSGSSGRRLIVTDSLFSMDGDLARLADLADLADRHGAMLLIDEAHATGVFGGQGRGVAEHLGLEERVHVRIGTLSKALGSVGGFVAGRRTLIDWLVNRARPYVFSTAAPGVSAAASLAALQIVRQEPQRRQQLLARAAALRTRLAALGWNTGRSASQIIPVIVGTPDRALALSAHLLSRGLLVPAIRPPTVPEGESCLRISLTSAHSDEMIHALLQAMGPAT
jgi:8-amino-7-oxononanoate synthase